MHILFWGSFSNNINGNEGWGQMAFQLWHQTENNNNHHNRSYLKSLFAQQPKQQNNAVHSKYLA